MLIGCYTLPHSVQAISNFWRIQFSTTTLAVSCSSNRGLPIKRKSNTIISSLDSLEPRIDCAPGSCLPTPSHNRQPPGLIVLAAHNNHRPATTKSRILTNANPSCSHEKTIRLAESDCRPRRLEDLNPTSMWLVSDLRELRLRCTKD